MVAELDPGPRTAAPALHSRRDAELARNTLPTVNLDEVLAQLDSDTRAELDDCSSRTPARRSANGGGQQLANVFRRSGPAVARRR